MKNTQTYASNSSDANINGDNSRMVHLCMLLAFSSAVTKMWELIILVAADVQGQTCFASMLPVKPCTMAVIGCDGSPLSCYANSNYRRVGSYFNHQEIVFESPL